MVARKTRRSGILAVVRIFSDAHLPVTNLALPMHPQLTWLMHHYAEVEERSWGELRVFWFAKEQKYALVAGCLYFLLKMAVPVFSNTRL